MAICPSCGKSYYSKRCPHCNGDVTGHVLGKTKKKSFAALIITLLIFTSIGLISYLIAELMHHQDVLQSAQQQAESEKQRKMALQREKERFAQQYRYENRNGSTVAKQKEHKAVRKYPEKIRTYPKFSKLIKLKSDSKITIAKDNRLQSNAPIYGIYDGALFAAPVCKMKEIRDVHLDNDCYVRTMFSMDKLYIKKSWVDEFAHYNDMHNKKIECEYSKKHGIMHSCKIWNS